MRRGFTLIEMIVVIGIVGILLAASIGAYSHFVASADRQRCQELVSDVATALTAFYNANGSWPNGLLQGGKGATDAELDENAGAVLVKDQYMTLSYKVSTDKDTGEKTYKLSGYDRFGVTTPWALTYIKAHSSGIDKNTIINTGGRIRDHILHYAIDDDGDGIVAANVAGEDIRVHATAIAWTCGKNGKSIRFKDGHTGTACYSWTYRQMED